MKAINKAAKRILDRLTEGLSTAGQSRKVDNAPGAFMAVHVERLSDTEAGAVFSIAHYYEQHGDLVPDPDMTFIRALDGEWYPLTIQDQFVYRVGAELRDGAFIVVDARQQDDLARSAN